MAARKTSRAGSKSASASRKKTVAKKPAVKTTAARKSAAKAAPAKQAAPKKAAPRRSAPKKAAPKKVVGKKAAAPRSGARRSGTRRSGTLGDGRVEEIQRMIDMMADRGAVEVELEETAAGSKLRVRLREEHPAQLVSYAAPAGAMPPMAMPGAAAGAAPAAEEAPLEDANHKVMSSPMVGTFYRSPSPEAGVFVQVGDAVTLDSTVCILEAMKVMNEIKAEYEGRVSKVLVQNGEPVEYGQPLLVIEVS